MTLYILVTLVYAATGAGGVAAAVYLPDQPFAVERDCGAELTARARLHAAGLYARTYTINMMCVPVVGGGTK